MAGYGDTPDAGAEAALDHVDNLIYASRSMLEGPVLSHCLDCGDPIPVARRSAAKAAGIKCTFCIQCQSSHDKAPRVKMLTHIL